MRRGSWVALAALCLLAVAPGSASAAPLTKSEYQSLLKKADAKIGKAISAFDAGLEKKKSSAQMKALLLAWAKVETDSGLAFQAIEPPADTASANTLLSEGEVLYGTELTRAANSLPKKRARIGAYLESKLGKAKGAAKIDRALAKLRKLGYR